MRLEKPHLAFIFFILINIGQTVAQEPEAIEEQVPEGQALLEQAPLTEKSVFRIETSLGYSSLGYREETDLPLNRYVDALSFYTNINIEANKFCYSFSLYMLQGETKPLEIKNDDVYFSSYQKNSDFIRFYIENALDYKLWGNNVFPGYLGYSLRVDLYYSALQESNYNSVTLLSSINTHLTQKWIISKKNELNFTVSTPFLGYAIRPPYFGLYYSPLDSEEEITSFHNYRAIFSELKYYHQIIKSFYFNVGLGFELSEITFPQPRKDAAFRINAGFAYSF
jgi:hypothetical protein